MFLSLCGNSLLVLTAFKNLLCQYNDNSLENFNVVTYAVNNSYILELNKGSSSEKSILNRNMSSSLFLYGESNKSYIVAIFSITGLKMRLRSKALQNKGCIS